MKYIVVIWCFTLIIICYSVKAQLKLDETCLRCLCHARSGCYSLKNCARYSISAQYWEQAKSSTTKLNSKSYKNCMKDDNCIMETIKGFIKSRSIKDCNCDGVIDCKDFAALHLKGDQCRSEFDSNMMKRLDRCLTQRAVNIASGWDLQCSEPEAV